MTDKKYKSGEKYRIFFDSILDPTLETEEAKEKRLKQNEEQKLRMEDCRKSQEEWLATSKVVEGIPGRCVICEKGSKDSELLDARLLKEWKEDEGSILYAYDDIEILSGTNGFILKKSNGKMFQQIIMMS